MRRYRLMNNETGRSFLALAALLNRKEQLIRSGVHIDPSKLLSYVRDLRLPTGECDVDKVGLVLVLAHDSQLKEAASDDKLSPDGTFGVVDHNTVEGSLNLEVLLWTYQSPSTGKNHVLARSLCSRRTIESRRYSCGVVFELLRKEGLRSPLDIQKQVIENEGSESVLAEMSAVTNSDQAVGIFGTAETSANPKRRCARLTGVSTDLEVGLVTGAAMACCDVRGSAVEVDEQPRPMAELEERH